MAEVMTPDGATELLSATTDENGDVAVGYWGSDGYSNAGTGSNSSTDCQDGTATVWAEHWVTAYPWWFNSGSTPSNLNVTNAETTLNSAVNNIVTARNNCGIADNVTATHNYRGRTSTGTNIGATNGCASRDGISVVSFGDLTSEKVGYSCWWYVIREGNYEMVEADIKLNKVEYGWWLPSFDSTCSGKYSVEAVLTHEFGHAYGLDHVSESTHGNLTMSSASNGTCQNSEATLGWGDINGLNVHY
jgi:hypothetical protein